jgi:hypothetical protein
MGVGYFRDQKQGLVTVTQVSADPVDDAICEFFSGRAAGRSLSSE